jgi:glycosyltransferase involved in cell wall biosynthesis
MSEFLYLDEPAEGSYREWHHFYNRTTRLYGKRPRGFLRRYVKGAEHVFDMFALPSFLKTLRPDVIHFQQAPLPSIDRWFLHRLSRVAPVVSTIHNTTAFHGEHKFRQFGFHGFLAQFDHLIVHADYSRKQLLEALGAAAPPISVIPHGVFDHYETVARPDTTKATSQEEQNILFFGNISRYKGIDILIRAFAELPPEHTQRTRLLICGNPQIDIGPIKALAAELGVQSRIEWDLRFIPEDQIHGIFERATVIAMPYRQIDASGVLATVVQYGVPVVASRIGGFPEIIHEGVHGYLVDPESPSALAAGLAAVLSDQERAKRMGEAVRKLSDGWASWENIAKRTVDVYTELQNVRKRR